VMAMAKSERILSTLDFGFSLLIVVKNIGMTCFHMIVAIQV